MSLDLRRVFTPEEPLGPSSTPAQFQREKNKRSFQRFFDDQNFLSREVIGHHPGTIMGRRGAGKTAYLYHLKYRGRFTFAIELDAGQSFGEVAEEIERKFGGSDSAHSAIVENVAKVWSKVIYTAIICTAYEEFVDDSRIAGDERLLVVREFLEKTGLINIRLVPRIFRAMVRLFENLSEASYGAGREFRFLSDFIEGDYRELLGFDKAWEALEDIMEEHSANVIVLIDSLEQFPVYRADMRLALAGLLHFVGETNRDLDPVSLCVCLPAELHEEFSGISDNTAKDFDRVLTLHWNPVELYQMCARRYSIYIESNFVGHTHKPDLLPAEPSRRDVWAFWEQFLPKKMINRYGVEEETVSYITRHTQLLPRHFLGVMNKIAKLAVGRDTRSFRFGADDIIEGVRLGEGEVCEGIMSGFKQKYPNAKDVLKLVIPNMPHIFTFEALQDVNRAHGAGLVTDTLDLLEMLMRMGVSGRLDEMSSVYASCRFDYTYNGQMPYSTEDTFGLHPTFSGQLRSAERWAPETPGDYRPVYPIEQFTGQRPRVGKISML